MGSGEKVPGSKNGFVGVTYCVISWAFEKIEVGMSETLAANRNT